jgi:hypothetical protein
MPDSSSSMRKPMNVPVESSSLNSPMVVSTFHVPVIPVAAVSSSTTDVIEAAASCRLTSSGASPRKK